MVSSELGACEWFVWDLRRSNLLDRGQLDQIVGEFLQKNPRAEPPDLSEYLVGLGILTQFQAERLLQGKTQGFVLGPFTLMDALGSGSMGTVYKAQSKTDNNWYAVKVLPRRSMWNVRLARRKVRAFEQCKHPTVVPFVDVGTSGGMHYLAWPLVEGESIDKKVAAAGKFSPGKAAMHAMQIAEGLDVTHQQGLIHGLMKPSNVMISATGEAVHILDFGIGCLLAETEGESLVDTMSTANAVSSGLDCASPESIMEPTNLTPAGDQYSLGCTLYYMLTGQYPFPDGSAAEKMMAHQFKQPRAVQDLAPDAPPGLIEVVNRLMQKAPEQRFPSVSEAVNALRKLADKPQTQSVPAKPAMRLGANAAGGPANPRPAPSTPRTGMGALANPPSPKLPSTPIPRPKTAMAGMQARPTTMVPGAGRAPAPALPSRDAVKAPAAPPPPTPVPVDPAQLAAVMDDGEPTTRWDERMGPIGTALLATLVCCMVFAVARFFNLL